MITNNLYKLLHEYEQKTDFNIKDFAKLHKKLHDKRYKRKKRGGK